jgi:CSLREA domain-containing protein
VKRSPRAASALYRNGVALGFLLVLILALVASGRDPVNATAASVFQVTKQADTADGVCDADCSLREAIIAANADDDESTINVPGSATHYLITNGLGDDGGLQGDFDVITNVTMQGAGIDQTIIDGNASDTVFQVQNGGALTLKGLTVRNGKAIGSSLGGGILAEGDLVLDTVNVRENAGPALGAGGIYATERVSMKNSTVDMNTSGNEGVGGLFANQEVDIANSTISDNTAMGVSSVGGIRLEWTGKLVDVTISGNDASGERSVGGMYTAFGEEVDLLRVTISGNSANGNYAVGGWWNATSVTAGNLVIEENQGGDHGAGGVYVECCNGGLDLSRAAVIGNAGGNDGGGGIWNESAAIITNVTVSGNSADANGAGGVYNSGLLTLVNVTIADNTAGAAGAGGLWNDDKATVRNTIVAVSGGSDCINSDSITSEGGNFSLPGGCGFTQPTDHENTDALLSPLASNGGFSQTRALLPGSPAINAGIACPPPDTDQRGVARPEGACDSGAYEVGELQPLQDKWGDVRCDGSVGGEDVTAILNAQAHRVEVSAVCPAPSDHVRVIDWFGDHLWGDVNCDEDVNALDALFLLRDLAELGLAASVPCPMIGETVSFD